MNIPVIVLRHGEYHKKCGSLTDKGESQAKNAADIIRELVGASQPLLVLSSGTPRAFETAQILAATLQAPVETRGWLTEHSKREAVVNGVQETYQSLDASTTLVLVTHIPVLNWLGLDWLEQGHCQPKLIEL